MNDVEISVSTHLARSMGIPPTRRVVARTLREALQAWAEEDGIGEVILTVDGGLQPFLRVFLDRDLVVAALPAELDGIAVAGRAITIKTAFAGG